MEQIKACPFCGREASLIDCDIYPPWFIKCTYKYCGVEQSHCYATKQAAIKAWNGRAGEKLSSGATNTEALKMQEQKSSGKKITRCADCFFWHELERCGYCNKHKIYVGQDDGCTMGEVDQ